MAKKNTPDLFNDPVEVKSQDFKSLFENSLSVPGRRLKVGDLFKGEILTIGKTESFVSTGTTQDAVVLTIDLCDEAGQLKYKAGDTIEAIVLRVAADEIRATRKGSKSAPADVDSLEDAFDMELPVEGKVTEVVNGGFRVNIRGQAAFCPISQLGLRQGQDPKDSIGKKFEFLITQFEPKKRNIVVSHRKYLDLKKIENEGLWIQKHKVGDIVSGRVTRTEIYGAFVDLGDGIEGLVHVSEIGFVRLKHASEGVRVGDPVQVKILNIEEQESRLKISLSIKAAGGVSDPWMQVPQSYPVGSIVDGTVEKKADFGVFVQLTPGVTGLLPKSKWRDSEDAKKYESLKITDKVKVKVDQILFEERKISLGLPTQAEDQSWREHQSAHTFGGAFGGSLAEAFARAQKK